MSAKLKIINGQVFGEQGTFMAAEVYACNERIVAKEAYDAADGPETIVDAAEDYVIPGLTDIHFHGCMGSDCCDGTAEAFHTIARYELSQGVTSITPATMTMSEETLAKICEAARDFSCPDGADFCGLYMEGPFISEEKKGAQDARNIISCNEDICRRFLQASGGLVKFVGIAPERSENTKDFILKMKDQVHISLAHTNADYDTAMEAFKAGADHAVHLYNAMPAFTHRNPGVVGAVSDSAHVNAEMICDGVHIHPSVVRATFKMLGADRIILISDSMRATGMPDGRYTLGGLEADVTGNRATLASNGALAGSATNLMDCMRTAVLKMGIPLETAVACATRNPARCLGVYGEYGSITPGKRGNAVLLDRELKVKAVIKDGVRVA